MKLVKTTVFFITLINLAIKFLLSVVKDKNAMVKYVNRNVKLGRTAHMIGKTAQTINVLILAFI